ncbi:MAG: HNH endonuclease [Parafilimonas sp.]|nr:HNH endonuclease [Parafilimonas sp.]
MKEGQTLWNRDELILAINLYCKLPFGKMHKGNPSVKELAEIIDRSPDAVARKLGNFASFDPSLKARGIKGLPKAGKLSEKIWNEFYNNWDAALIESERLLAKNMHTIIEKLNEIDTKDLLKQGLDKKRIVNTRINQCIFRKMILATYNNTCCITGINKPELLTASHIVQWSKDKKNRLNPMNGLCLNALHDRAFDNRLITISANDYTIKISSAFKKKDIPKSIEETFLRFEGMRINLPDKFLPSKEFLKVHNHFFDRKE